MASTAERSRLALRNLERRRQELGISRAILACKSGVSLPTVNRILTGNSRRASFGNVMAIANVLGLELIERPADEIRQRQALAKARRLVKIVQGTSALELQSVPTDAEERMVNQTVHELLASSGRKLWSEL